MKILRLQDLLAVLPFLNSQDFFHLLWGVYLFLNDHFEIPVKQVALSILWMLFLDNNDVMSRIRLSRKLNSLENEKEYYQEKIKEVEKDRNELFGDKESIEKFAREKYLMKKETEDIFIVREE